MPYASSFMRPYLAACVVMLFAAGCGSPQVSSTPLAPTAQSVAPAGVQPAVDCPVVGKTYTRSDGNGQAALKFQEAWTKAGPYESYLRTELVYRNWPSNRPFVYRKITVSTCGLESGKPAVGQAREGTGRSDAVCRDGRCTYTLHFDVVYQPPLKLQGGKRWKFDLIRYAPDKPTKGFDPIPIYRVVVTR